MERSRIHLTPVVLESPLSGETKEIVARNIRYAKAAMRDSLSRGEAPFASHLLYAQDGILDDNTPEDRRLGIDAGLAWGDLARVTVVYTDLGISAGMRIGIEAAEWCGRRVVYRSIEDEDWDF